MIRVWLSSIGGKGTYNLTVTSGTYTVGGQTVSSGGKIKVEFSGGTVYVTANGTRSAMGTSATVSRQSGGVKIAESLAPSNTYPGDMRFFYSNGTAYVVCYLYIEEYVYGVLPYEMDNSFPLEALKAQAVAARTYGMRAKTSSGVYDVTDTTNHQVFRGVNYNMDRCIQAVNETWNIVIKHNGSYAGAYFSASNGGQTEANNHVWGGTQLPYLQIKDDPYDLANTRAVSKSYMIYKSTSYGSSVSAYTMIKNALAKKLGGSAGDYTITQVTDVTLHTPMYAAPSKLYTQLRVTVTLGGGGSAWVDIPIFTTAESSLGLGINGSKNELYTVTAEENGFRVTARRYGHGVGMSQRGAQQMGETGLTYAQILGFYYTGVQRVRLNLKTNWPSNTQVPDPVEDPTGVTGETPARVSLSNPGDRLNLRASASASGSIIGKISHGEQVTVLSGDGTWCKVRYGTLTGYVGRAYLAIGETPSASTGNPGTAVVTLSSGTLNLRSEGRANATAIGRLPNGATVTVVEKGAVWTRVYYNGQTGYAMSDYLTFAEETPASEPTPGATAGGTAMVTLENTSETLNLRMDPEASAPILARLKHGTALTVLSRGAEWTQVSYAGMTGHVMNMFVTFAGDSGAAETPQPTQAPSPTQAAEPTAQPAMGPEVSIAWAKTNDGDRVNLRRTASTSSMVLVRVPHGAEVAVLDYGDTWCMVAYGDYIGYMVTEYLSATNPLSGGSGAAGSGSAAASAWIYTKDGSGVYFRKQATASSGYHALLTGGTEVAVNEIGETWCRVTYQGVMGFVLSDCLVFANPNGGTGASGGSAAAPQSAGKPSVSLAAGLLNTGTVRSGQNGLMVTLYQTPSTQADMAGTLIIGDAVEVTAYSGDLAEWVYVRCGAIQGYTRREYLSLDYKVACVKVNDADGKLSIRSEANAASTAVALLNNGAGVTMLTEPSGGWVYVRHQDGQEGFASSSYLQEQ